MPRETVDLAAHLNHTVESGHPADFRVGLQPIFHRPNGHLTQVPRRLAVVREDTGTVLGVVSDRYSLLPHQRLLDVVEPAISQLDVGSVPRGIYVDRQGARMRALFKFPSLARPITDHDQICPCLMIRNTYDGTSRVLVHIGAFRFVCTNLAVGGGGVFAGGFMSVHTGDIPIDEVAAQLADYLAGFEDIVELYSHWRGIPFGPMKLSELLEPLPMRTGDALDRAVGQLAAPTIYDAYNAATHHATHKMRSYRTAFDLLWQVNEAFQERWPLTEA